MKHLLINLAMVGILVMGCTQNAADRILFKINEPEIINREYRYEDEVNVKVDGQEFDSLRIGLNDHIFYTPTIKLNAENAHFGMNTLRIFIYYDGKKMERTLNISVFPRKSAELWSVQTINSYPHNTSYFTQGLHYEDGMVYESTGQKKQSRIVKYKLQNGEVLEERKLEDQYFGEGIAKAGNKIFQLSWKSQKGFIYDAQTLDQTGSFSYPFVKEGWGLCFAGTHFVLSNGTHFLYNIDTAGFKLQNILEVMDSSQRYTHLNELGYNNGKIYANVWYQKQILVIDPQTGVVEARISLENIPAKYFEAGVANGIAFKDGNLLITGKNWPELLEVKVLPLENSDL